MPPPLAAVAAARRGAPALELPASCVPTNGSGGPCPCQPHVARHSVVRGESRLPDRRAQRTVARGCCGTDSPSCASPTPTSHPPPNVACPLVRRNFPLAFPYVVWLTRRVVPYAIWNLGPCWTSKLSRSATRYRANRATWSGNAVAFAQRPTPSDRSSVALADCSLARRGTRE